MLIQKVSDHPFFSNVSTQVRLLTLEANLKAFAEGRKLGRE
jgi:hypothetical protein